ncbi:MAG: DUF4288 domain-containing protein, partial [Acidobacteriota bacterium]|nr:DUF4288 domain-containing protein [Acidobacteriota bacterium]
MTFESRCSWYVAYLLYQTRSPNAVYSEKDLVPIQEDLILIESQGADEAYAKVIALGNAVGEFGQDLLDGKPDAFLELGLNNLGLPPLEYEGKTHGDSRESRIAASPLVHP